MVITKVKQLYNTGWQYYEGITLNYRGKRFYNNCCNGNKTNCFDNVTRFFGSDLSGQSLNQCPTGAKTKSRCRWGMLKVKKKL
jgi:hypothetical protein